jgi:hypothetical protein
VQSGTDAAKWRFPSGVPGKRLLLAGVEVNATLLDPKTPQELKNRRKTLSPLQLHRAILWHSASNQLEIKEIPSNLNAPGKFPPKA